MSPALKGHRVPPPPSFSPCATLLHARSPCDPPSHRPASSPTWPSASPPPLLQHPHGELPPSTIIVLHHRPLLSPRPHSCCKTHQSSSSVTGARLPPPHRPDSALTVTVSFELPLLARHHPHYMLKLWGKTMPLEHHRSAAGKRDVTHVNRTL
jgi:hypothetical protein